MNRRDLFRAASGIMAASAWAGFSAADDLAAVFRPRAVSGDAPGEPDWERRLVITVGHTGADIAGASEKPIQAAVDYVARLGGGTVHVLAGLYRMRNAIYLPSGVRLTGEGAETVLFKEPSVETTLAEDSDWYDQEITLADAAGFEVGDGVCLRTVNPHHGGRDVVKRTLVARSGNRFKLDRGLRQNFWTGQEHSVATLFALITAENAADIAIENLVLDGNREQNAHLDGNYAGCVWFQDCCRIAIRGVEARNYNGDGLSWQICHDVLVEHCHCHDNADLGMHPGSGAQRPVVRNNRIERNSIGLFFCWGVKYGLAEDNSIVANRECGISIGHRDDHNLVRNNEVRDSGRVGILFRPERGEGFTASGNRIEDNRVIDSGPDDGVAVDIQGVTAGNVIARNALLETRAPASRIGIRLGAQAGENELTDNRIEGFAVSVADQREG